MEALFTFVVNKLPMLLQFKIQSINMGNNKVVEALASSIEIHCDVLQFIDFQDCQL